MIDADLRLLRHVAEIVEREQIDVGRLLADLTALMRDHQLALPPDLALLFKAAISLEGLGRMLDPGFDMVSEALPFLQRIASERRSPRALAKTGMKSLCGNPSLHDDMDTTLPSNSTLMSSFFTPGISAWTT